jgi:hypothetical protein
MTEEAEECPVWAEYAKWFEAEMLPKMREFYGHAANCPSCRKKLLEGKEQMLLGMLKTSDAELVEEMGKLGGEDQP